MSKNISFGQTPNKVTMRFLYGFLVLIPAPCGVERPFEEAIIIQQKTAIVGKKTHGAIEMRRPSKVQKCGGELFWGIHFDVQPSASVLTAANPELRGQLTVWVKLCAHAQPARGILLKQAQDA
jgi:hypothetical protein